MPIHPVVLIVTGTLVFLSAIGWTYYRQLLKDIDKAVRWGTQ